MQPAFSDRWAFRRSPKTSYYVRKCRCRSKKSDAEKSHVTLVEIAMSLYEIALKIPSYDKLYAIIIWISVNFWFKPTNDEK